MLILTVISLSALIVTSDAQGCNPLQGTCTAAIPGLSTSSYLMDFTQQKSTPVNWTLADYSTVNYGSNGAEFAFAKRFDAPYMWTSFYMLFGKIEVVLQAAPGQGIVSSSVMMSDDLDEIDWEWSGSNFADSYGKVQTNYFGKGIIGNYERGAFSAETSPQTMFHTYTLDWTSTSLTWYIDGVAIRTLQNTGATSGVYQYPQTPSQLHLGLWNAGDPTINPGTTEWAGGIGGYTDLSKVPYTAYVKSVKITNYNPCSSWQYPAGFSGKWQDIKCTNTTIATSTTSSSAISTPTNLPCTYTDAAGDTGYGIATKLGISFDDLNKTNPGQNWDQLMPGITVLKVPGGNCSSVSSSMTTTTTSTKASSMTTTSSVASSTMSPSSNSASSMMTSSSAPVKSSSASSTVGSITSASSAVPTSFNSQCTMPAGGCVYANPSATGYAPWATNCAHYAVQTFDNGCAIANKFGVDYVCTLLALNPKVNWQSLQAGQQLLIGNPIITPNVGVTSIPCPTVNPYISTTPGPTATGTSSALPLSSASSTMSVATSSSASVKSSPVSSTTAVGSSSATSAPSSASIKTTGVTTAPGSTSGPVVSSTITTGMASPTTGGGSNVASPATTIGMGRGIYTVVSGDYGYKIAPEVGCSNFDQLSALNPTVDWNTLLIGQTLTACGVVSASPSTASAAGSGSGSLSTTVGGSTGSATSVNNASSGSPSGATAGGATAGGATAGGATAGGATGGGPTAKNTSTTKPASSSMQTATTSTISIQSGSSSSSNASSSLSTTPLATQSTTAQRSSTSLATTKVMTTTASSAALLTTSKLTTTTPIPITTPKPTTTTGAMVCTHDNCLNNLLDPRYSSSLLPFCSQYIATHTGAFAIAIPTVITNCQNNNARVSSACACLVSLQPTSAVSATTTKATASPSPSLWWTGTNWVNIANLGARQVGRWGNGWKGKALGEVKGSDKVDVYPSATGAAAGAGDKEEHAGMHAGKREMHHGDGGRLRGWHAQRREAEVEERGEGLKKPGKGKGDFLKWYE